MADSSINVTEGSGKRLQTYDHTIGAVLVQRQAVVLGEQALASYMFQAAASTATVNSHLIQIMAGSTYNVRVRYIEVSQWALATTAILMQLALYRLTTAGTGGTSVTPLPLNPADAAAGFSAMILPSSKGTEAATALWAGAPYMMQTVAASAQQSQPLAVIDFDRPRSQPLIIAAGTSNGIALKTLTAVAGGQVMVTVVCDETAW